MHANAAGFCLPAKNLSTLHEHTNRELANIDFGEDVYDVNFMRTAADKDVTNIIFDVGVHEDVWGTQNPEPRIFVSDINFSLSDIQVMGKNKDTLKIEKFGVSYMKFHAKDLIEELKQHNQIKMNIVGKANVNEYFGNVTPQIFIESYEVFDGALAF